MIEDSNSPSKAVALVFARLAECLAELQAFPQGEEFRYFSRFPEFAQLTRDLKLRSSALLPRDVPWQQGTKEAHTRLDSVRKAIEEAQHRGSEQGARLQLQFAEPVCNEVSVRVLVQSKWWKLAPAASCPVLEGEVKEAEEKRNLPLVLPLPSKIDQKCPESAQLVGNFEEFQDMLSHLATVKELGVYVVYQTARSYQGFTRALGLVSRSQAFVLDAVALRVHLPALQPLLSSPSVLKVMHKGHNWAKLLERDLGIAVATCFDLSEAAKRLKLPSSTLTFLFKSYCGVSVSPQLGLLDWSCAQLSPIHVSALHSGLAATLKLYDLLRKELESKVGTEAVMDAMVEKAEKLSERKAEKGLLGELKKWRKRVAQMTDDNEESICPTESLNQWAQTPSLDHILTITPYTQSAAPYLLSLLQKPTQSTAPCKPANDIYERVGWKATPSPECSYKPLLDKAVFSDTHLEHLFGIESWAGEVRGAVAVLAKMKEAGRLTYVSVAQSPAIEDLGENCSPEEWEIPQSVEEIYDLANANRKRAKKGKMQAEVYIETSTAPKQCDMQAIFKQLGWAQLSH